MTTSTQKRESLRGAAGCGCVGKMTLESSGNFGYFVWLPSRPRRSPRGRGAATATVQNAAMFNLRQTNEQTRRIVKLREGLAT